MKVWPTRWFCGTETGKASTSMLALAAGFLPSAETRDEVVRPGDELALGIDRALHLVKAARAVEIVRQVVFARPLQLDRRADLLGDRRHLAHVVIGQPPAEAAAGARLVDQHFALVDAEQLGDLIERAVGRLRRRPELDAAVLVSAVQFCGSMRRMC